MESGETKGKRKGNEEREKKRNERIEGRGGKNKRGETKEEEGEERETRGEWEKGRGETEYGSRFQTISNENFRSSGMRAPAAAARAERHSGSASADVAPAPRIFLRLLSQPLLLAVCGGFFEFFLPSLAVFFNLLNGGKNQQ